MKFYKNPLFWGLVLFAGGMFVGAWGWDKNESTITGRTHFAIPLIILGILMIIGGILIFFTIGNSKNRKW